jgi:hypothetical protein
MASVVVNGDTSGAVTLSAPAVAGTVTVTLPSTSGTMAVLPTATGVLAESAGGTGTTTGYYGFKNRIINGAMVINQRGASVTSSGYTVDRFQYVASVGSKGTLAQSTSVYPTGFNYSLGFTSSSAYSVGASELFTINQCIEGYNIADLGWGTANAKTVTLSFWVYSSLTGTFGGSLSSYASTRSYPFTYTISSANTWEQKSITVAGDTTGTWYSDNNAGMNVWFGLGVGSTVSGTAGAWAGTAYYSATGATSVVGTNGATFYITGVQLEKGSTATSFDYRPYGTELNLCLRYFYKVVGTSSYPTFGAGAAISTTEGRIAVQYPVQMRATPTLSFGGTVLLTASNGNGITVTSIAVNYGNETGGMVGVGVASGLSAGNGTLFITQNGSSSNFIQATAEL